MKLVPSWKTCFHDGCAAPLGTLQVGNLTSTLLGLGSAGAARTHHLTHQPLRYYRTSTPATLERNAPVDAPFSRGDNNRWREVGDRNVFAGCRRHAARA